MATMNRKVTAIGPSPNGGWFNKVDVTLRVTKAAKCGQGIHHSESDGYYESQSDCHWASAFNKSLTGSFQSALR